MCITWKKSITIEINSIKCRSYFNLYITTHGVCYEQYIWALLSSSNHHSAADDVIIEFIGMLEIFFKACGEEVFLILKLNKLKCFARKCCKILN